jgi:hypothetical protein
MAPAKKKTEEPAENLSAVQDELEALKAQGNPDPDRLAELKAQLRGE